MPDITEYRPSKKINICLISPQNICPKVLGIIKISFFANVRRAFVFFLVRSRTAKMAEKLNSNFLLKYYHN